MDFDDIVLERHEDLRKAWVEKFCASTDDICKLVGQFRGSNECLFKSMHCGAFNHSIRLHWQDGGSDWLIRFPIPGRSMLPDEKVRNEVSVMKFIEQNTSIPVPSVVGYGMGIENPTGLGPFIIMTFVEGRQMSEVMKSKTTGEDDDDDEVLDPDIDDLLLKNLYGQMADILLELFQHDFSHIGSLSLDSDNSSWVVKHRPTTQSMNAILMYSGLSEDCFPSRAYSSSADYLLQLSEIRSVHLLRQRNSIIDGEDCREKYTCRHLFQAIIPQFICREENAGPFKLTCDDFCPGNILVDDNLQIVAVIDWEFCYAAPVQFSTSPPWWLLLRKPADWLHSKGPEDFLKEYVPKVELFLQIMEQREEARARTPTERPLSRLSGRMRQSMDDKTVWFNMAARKSYGFENLYWYMLDKHCYGPRTSEKERVTKVTEGVSLYSDREDFVRMKIKQLQEYNAELGRENHVTYEEHNPDLIPNDSRDF